MNTTTPTWQNRQTLALPGLRVTLAEPVALGRHRGSLWFPNLWPMPNGDLPTLTNTSPRSLARPSSTFSGSIWNMQRKDQNP